MLNAKVVIAGSIVALVIIYFLPRFDEAARKAYGRWRRQRREQRLERERLERQERLDRMRNTSPQ